MQPQQEPMMLGQAAIQRLGEGVPLVAQPAPGQLSHRGRRGATFHERGQHRHAGDPEHVGCDAGQLDIRRLE